MSKSVSPIALSSRRVRGDKTPSPAEKPGSSTSRRKSLDALKTNPEFGEGEEEHVEDTEGEGGHIIETASENGPVGTTFLDDTGASEEVKKGTRSQSKVDLVEPAAEASQQCQKKLHCFVWVKSVEFTGQPKREILIEALCWTVDYYMKIFRVDCGSVMIGEQVGSVIESRSENYPQYMLVVISSGWRTHTIVNPEDTYVRKFIDIVDLPASLYLGTLGLPGLTAYFGLLDICQPNVGDVVLVNAAAGPVGNVVGQLARIKGCTVIAFAGSKARCHWIRELGFDFVFNYSTVTVTSALHRVAPRGVDFYFDCVGSEFTEAVLSSLKESSTICTFGYVTSYGRHTIHAQPEDPYRIISMRERQILTTSVYDYEPFFDDATRQMLDWIQQGKLKYKELLHMYSGFERLPDALADLNRADFYGKIIIKSDNIDSLLTLPVEY